MNDAFASTGVTGVDRPLVSFVLVAYNQEAFIADAVEGALAQTYHPLEIILSDDGSTDRTFEIMRERAAAYSGPHKLILNRNDRNLGIGGHFNRCFKLSSGALLVPAAGDDVSLPCRCDYLYREWEAHGHPHFMCSGWYVMNAAGEVDPAPKRPGGLGERAFRVVDGSTSTLLAYLREGNPATPGAAAAYSGAVCRDFRAMDSDVLAEDYALFFRSLLLGRALLLAEPLVRYRWHGSNVASVKGPGAERFRVWTIRHAPTFRCFQNDVLCAHGKRLIDRRKRDRLMRAARRWTRCVPYLRAWGRQGPVRRFFFLFPALFFCGNRRIKKFALRNVRPREERGRL